MSWGIHFFTQTFQTLSAFLVNVCLSYKCMSVHIGSGNRAAMFCAQGQVRRGLPSPVHASLCTKEA